MELKVQILGSMKRITLTDDDGKCQVKFCTVDPVRITKSGDILVIKSEEKVIKHEKAAI